jgi:RHS repeat-associated protein
LQPTSGDIPDQMKRVRELTVYDANGSAMRFLAFISQPNDPSPYREQWQIVPTRGVNATLTADVDETGAIRGFTLVGGPPGRIREGGSWVYHFARPVRDLGWGGAFKSRLHDNITILGGEVRSSPAIVSPNFNSWSVQVGTYANTGQWLPNPDGVSGEWLVLRDFQTKRGLRWNRLTGDVYYFALENELQAVHIGKVPPEGAARSWELIWHNRAPNTTQDRIVAQLQSSGGRGGYDTYRLAAANSSTDARTQVQSWLYWTDIPTREKDMYSHAYGREPENLRGRLSGEALGSLSQRYSVMSYGYQYLDGRAFLTQITRPRPGEDFRAQLLHTWTVDGMFSEMTLVRRSYVYNDPDRAWERVVLRFNGQGQAGEGQIQSIEVYDQIGRDTTTNQPIFSPVPRWSESFLYSSQHPFAITQHIDRQGTIWEFDYVPNPNPLLQSLKVDGGRLGEASVQYGQAHVGLPYDSHTNPPTAPTHVQVGNNPSLTWRFDYTYGGQPYGGVSANGLLAAFTEPGRTGWWQLRYYDGNSLYPNKLREIEDPTGRIARIRAYDLFGRPARVELFPTNLSTPLWGETVQTLFGQLLLARWGYGNTQSGVAQWEWDGLFLRRYTDPRGHQVRFVYDFDSTSEPTAGLLRQIWLEDGQGNSKLYAELKYDEAGRLQRVQNGRLANRTVVGLTYSYGMHDELRSIHHDGDRNPETFDYSCCGRVERWTRQDGRSVSFSHTPNGWLELAQENDHLGNPVVRHQYAYDPAGRLGAATKHLHGSQEQIALRWWYDTEAPNFGVSADPRNQDNDSSNDLQSTRTGWLLGEQVNLPVGNYFWLYDYRTPDGTPTADLQTFSTSWGSVWRYQYDGAGRPTALYRGGSLFAEWSYDNAGRLKTQTVRLPAGALTATIRYADDQVPHAVGQLIYTLNGQRIAQFSYDGLPNDPGYYPDGTLRFAREWLPGNRTAEWRWDYYPDGSLQSETSRLDGNAPQQITFDYNENGNLIRWGNAATDWRYAYNQLWWVGGSHPYLGSYNWYFTYTPNGERARLWNAPAPIEGDVNGDGCVDDQDQLQVLFAFGQTCPQGCPEDLNRDGQVDDADLLTVQFNFGQCANALSWTYQYDVWGNLTRASSSLTRTTLNHLYDSLGRRVGVFVHRPSNDGNDTWLRLYRLYEGDTLLAEVDGSSGQVVAEYVWGPLGPIARLDYADPARTRYYVLDGRGHTRVLLTPDGAPAELWTYDSWGNPIAHEVNPAHGAVAQPFTWNAAYGYEWDCFAGTGLYHVGARAYDPRTARWLQRDPIDAASGDPNLYRYAGNDPVNQIDPDGTNWTYHDLLDAAGFIPVVGEIADLANAVGYALEGDWVNAGISAAGVIPVVGDVAKAGRVGKKVVQELVEGGSGQAAKRQAKNAPQQQSTNQSANYSSSAHKFGGNNPHAQKGRQAHDQFKQKARQKGWEVEKELIDPATGKKCRPDAITPKGHPVELKPNTPSGRRRGKKQIEKYERAAGKRGRVIYY